MIGYIGLTVLFSTIIVILLLQSKEDRRKHERHLKAVVAGYHSSTVRFEQRVRELEQELADTTAKLDSATSKSRRGVRNSDVHTKVQNTGKDSGPRKKRNRSGGNKDK